MTPDVDAFLYAANHDWAREEAIRKEIAREVYITERGHPLQNTIGGLLGALSVIVLAAMWFLWSSEDENRSSGSSS